MWETLIKEIEEVGIEEQRELLRAEETELLTWEANFADTVCRNGYIGMAY